jgi:hypothetical protein
MSQTNYAPETIDRYNNPKEWKKMKLDVIRLYHAAMIQDLGISPFDFNMKMPFYDKHGRYVVGIFSSEFEKTKGFFFELVTRDLDPLEPDRKVYRIAYNENFEEEFEMNEKGSFLVPVDELRIVNAQSVAISKGSAVTSNDKLFSSKPVSQPQVKQQPALTSNIKTIEPKEDALYSEMTIRDYMAIHTGKPVSLKSWINDLVLNH